MRSRALVIGGGIVAAAVAIILVVGLVGWLNERKAKDFRADAVASGFTIAEGKNNPSKTTAGHLELRVVVNGCTVELERKAKEKKNVKKKRKGRDVLRYSFDEAVGPGGREIEVDNAPSSPTAGQVSEFLRANKSRFEYCLKV